MRVFTLALVALVALVVRGAVLDDALLRLGAVIEQVQSGAQTVLVRVREVKRAREDGRDGPPPRARRLMRPPRRLVFSEQRFVRAKKRREAFRARVVEQRDSLSRARRVPRPLQRAQLALVPLHQRPDATREKRDVRGPVRRRVVARMRGLVEDAEREERRPRGVQRELVVALARPSERRF
eukprot:29006-Pelagococcus_subviridis.AAC.9